PGHPDLPAREPAVHDEPQGHPLFARLPRRTSPGAPREPLETRDPAPDRRAPPAPGGAEGGAEPRRGPHVARDGTRDRADDSRRRPRDRVAEGPAVERSLGLMCGAGELPALMASEARRQGWRVVAFAFARETGAAAHAARVVPCTIAEMAPVIAALQEEKVTGVLFSGKFWMGDLLRTEAVDDAHRAMARRAGGLLDGNVRNVLLTTLGVMGIELLDQRPFLGAGLPGETVLGARTPTPDEWADVRRGLAVARAAAEWSVGQTVVVRREAVSAVEAIEGTTAAIRRGTALGGPGVAAEGVELLVDVTAAATMGGTEAVGGVPGLYRAYRRLRAVVTGPDRPDALVVIDFPEFNLRLARAARRAGVAVAYFVPPQVWAWRPWRVRLIRRVVSLVLAVFPFETALYRRAGVPVAFVGHPVLDALAEAPSRAEARKELGVDGDAPVVGLLPGSRRHEVAGVLPMMRAAAGRIVGAHPDARFLVARAPTVDAAELGDEGGPPLR